jgi:long-chain acyl-CoA synthetase
MTCELYYNLIYDNTIAICSNKNKFIDECGQVRPNVLYLVPKVLDTIKNKLEILDKPIIRIVLPKILNKLLGNNIQNIFIGGAKLDPSTRQFYDNNGITLCEGYGCSETSPMISVNHISYPRNSKSIGKILDNVLVKIIDNEICVHGPNVMKGYWESPTENHNAFIHYDSKKWYKTGDSGFIKDGFLFYKGRISENYKMSNGKFVNVSMVESEIKEFIKTNYIIYGENMEYNVLIVEKPFDKKLLKNINEKLDSYMKIRRIITLSPEQIEEFLTPKQSIKRNALIQFIKDNNYLY